MAGGSFQEITATTLGHTLCLDPRWVGGRTLPSCQSTVLWPSQPRQGRLPPCPTPTLAPRSLPGAEKVEGRGVGELEALGVGEQASENPSQGGKPGGETL